MESFVDEMDSLVVPDLSTDVPDWCPNCQQLRQEIKRLQDEQVQNFGKLKQKIISTDLLIKKYKSKCEDHDLQCKKMEEATKRADKYQRQSEILETQLKAALLDTEPLRKAKAKLETELRQKSTETQSLSDKLVAAEGAQLQYEHLVRASSSDVEKLEAEKKELVQKVKTLESGKVSKETAKLYRNEISTLKKENLALSKNEKRLEMKLKAAVTKTEQLMQSLQDKKLSPRHRRRSSSSGGFMSPLKSPLRSPRELKSSPISKGHRTRNTSEKESPSKEEVVLDKPSMNDAKPPVDDVDISTSDEDDNESLCSVSWTFSPMVKCLSPLPPSPACFGNRLVGNTMSAATESDDAGLSDMADELEQQLMADPDNMTEIKEETCKLVDKQTCETSETEKESDMFDIDSMENPVIDIVKFENMSELVKGEKGVVGDSGCDTGKVNKKDSGAAEPKSGELKQCEKTVVSDSTVSQIDNTSDLSLKEKLKASIEIVSPKAAKKRIAHGFTSVEQHGCMAVKQSVSDNSENTGGVEQHCGITETRTSPRNKSIKSDSSVANTSKQKNETCDHVQGIKIDQQVDVKGVKIDVNYKNDILLRTDTEELLPVLSDKIEPLPESDSSNKPFVNKSSNVFTNKVNDTTARTFAEVVKKGHQPVSVCDIFVKDGTGVCTAKEKSVKSNKQNVSKDNTQIGNVNTESTLIAKAFENNEKNVSEDKKHIVNINSESTTNEKAVENNEQSISEDNTQIVNINSESASVDGKSMENVVNEIDVNIEEQLEPVDIKTLPSRSFLKRQEAVSGKENELKCLENINIRQKIENKLSGNNENATIINKRNKATFEKSRTFSSVDNKTATKSKFDRSKFIAFQKSSSGTLENEIECLKDVNDYDVVSRTDRECSQAVVGSLKGKKFKNTRRKLREKCKYKDYDKEDKTEICFARQTRSRSKTGELEMSEGNKTDIKMAIGKRSVNEDSICFNETNTNPKTHKEMNIISCKEQSEMKEVNKTSLEVETVVNHTECVSRERTAKGKRGSTDSESEPLAPKRVLRSQRKSVNENINHEDMDDIDNVIGINSTEHLKEFDKKSEIKKSPCAVKVENNDKKIIKETRADKILLVKAEIGKSISDEENIRPSRQESTGFLARTSASFERLCSESPVSPFAPHIFSYDKNEQCSRQNSSIAGTCETVIEDNEEDDEKENKHGKDIEVMKNITEHTLCADKATDKKEPMKKESEKIEDIVCDKLKESDIKPDMTENLKSFERNGTVLNAHTKEIKSKNKIGYVLNDTEINKPGCSYTHQDPLDAFKCSSGSLSQEIESIIMKKSAPLSVTSRVISCTPDTLNTENMNLSRSTTPSIERTSPLSPLSISPFDFITPISPLPPSPLRNIESVSPLSPDHFDKVEEMLENVTPEIVTNPDNAKESPLQPMPGTPKSCTLLEKMTFSPLPAMLSPIKTPKGKKPAKHFTGGLNSAFKQVTKPGVQVVDGNLNSFRTGVDSLQVEDNEPFNASRKLDICKNEDVKKTSVKFVSSIFESALTVNSKVAVSRKPPVTNRTKVIIKPESETTVINKQCKNSTPANVTGDISTVVQMCAKNISEKGDNLIKDSKTHSSHLQRLVHSGKAVTAGINERGDSNKQVLDDLPSGHDNLVATKKKTRLAHKPNVHQLKPQKVEIIEAPLLPPVTVGRKRKNLKVTDKDGKEKKPCKEHLFLKKKTETSKVTKEESKRMQAFLQSTNSAESFISTVTIDDDTEDVGYRLLDACLECLNRMKTDSLEVVYNHCENGKYLTLEAQWPFLNDAEKQTVCLLQLLLRMKLQCSGIMLRLWESIFRRDLASSMVGKMSVCRVFTAMCRLQGDVEQARVLFYHIATCSYLNHWLFVVPVVSVWPEVLKRDENDQIDKIYSHCMTLVLEEIITKVLASQESDCSRKTMKILETLCNWSGNHGNADGILKTLLVRLADVTKADAMDRSPVFAVRKAIELLSVSEGWHWFKEQFIMRQGLQTTVNRYTAKKISTPITPMFMCAILRITGCVISALAENVKAADYKMICRNWLIPVLNKKPVEQTVSECCLEVSIELSALQPAMLSSIQLALTNHEGTVAPSVKHKLENLRTLYQGRFGLVCGPFVVSK